MASHFPGTPRRADGSLKGRGYLGELARPDGRVSSELSIGLSFDDGIEREMPMLVPTLTNSEVQALLRNEDPSPLVLKKVSEFYWNRMKSGKPAFAAPGGEHLFQTAGRPMPSHGPPSVSEALRR
jgi:hypothetical protein